MKRIIRLFNTFVSWQKESIEADQPTVPLPGNPDNTAEISVPEINDSMPDIYAEEKSVTDPLLKVVDQPTPDDDESV